MEISQSKLCLLFAPSLCPADPWATLDAAIEGGVDLVQWREKTQNPSSHRAAEQTRRVCQDRFVPFVVNDDIQLAIDLGADGAHVGQDDTAADVARELLGPGRLLGVSTHSAAEVRLAIAARADYVGFGPMHPTATKGYESGQPHGAFEAAREIATIPVFAIGGITPARLPTLRSRGVERIAVCAAILRALDPRATARALRTHLDGAGSQA